MSFKEGDRIIHDLQPDEPLTVVRVDVGWAGDTVLLVQDDSGATFKVEGWQARKEGK